MPEDARGHIATRAQGNPLFIEQLVALAAEDPGAPADAIPGSIQSVLSARVDRLAPDERRLLERASIIGLEFSLRWRRCAVRGADLGRRKRGSRSATCRGRTYCGPAGRRCAQRAEYRFGHILIRDVVYGSVLKATRAELHERFARWLEEDLRKRAGEVDEIVGYHLECSYLFRKELDPDAEGLEELADEAGERLCAAGVKEIDSSNPRRGADLLERALGLMVESNPRRGFALRQLAHASRLMGRWKEGLRHLDEALAWAQATGDRALSEVLKVNGLQHRLYTDPAFTLEEFANASARALGRLTSSGSEDGVAAIQVTLAWAYALRGHHQAAADLLGRALEIEERGERRALFPSLWLGGPLTVDEAIERCEGLLGEEPPPRTTASCYRSLAVLKAMQGDFDAARLLTRRDRRILDELGLPVLREQCETIRATVEQLAAEPALAEAVLRRSIRELHRLGSPMNVSGLSAQLARSLMDQGRDDEAWSVLEAARESPTSDVTHLVDTLGVGARLLLGQGHSGEAEQRAQQGVVIADATDSPDLQACARLDLAHVLIGRGKHENAIHACGDALRRFEQKGNLVESKKTRAMLATLRRGIE